MQQTLPMECVYAPACAMCTIESRLQMELKTLIEKRNKLVADAGAIAQSNDITTEQRAQVKAMFVDIDKLQEDIDIATRLNGFKEENRSNGMPPRAQPGESLELTPEKNELEKRAFKNYVTGRLTAEDHQHLKYEQRDLTVGAVGAVTGGGVLVPIGYDPILHTALKAYGEILTVVRNWKTDTGNGIRVSLANDTAQSFTLIAEDTAVTESDPSFAGFTSYTDTLTGGLQKVSNQLIADSAFDIEQFLSESLSQRYFRGVSNAIIAGNSSNIASIVTGASVGFTLPTGGATAISYASLVALYASLDPAYIPNSNFVMNSTTWAELMNVTDAQNRPLLQSDTNGAPFRSLFGRNLLIAQALPNPAASNSPILFGSFSDGYTFRSAGQMVVRKLVERYAEFDATGFVSFARVGGYSTASAGAPNPIVKLVMSAT
jgi:HK97 family phage major capsid protein